MTTVSDKYEPLTDADKRTYAYKFGKLETEFGFLLRAFELYVKATSLQKTPNATTRALGAIAKAHEAAEKVTA